MAQDKKFEEKEYLKYFLNTQEGKKWYQKYKFKHCIDEEHPDFIFITHDNKKIGLEVTQFIIESKHGKAVQALKRTGNKICKCIQDKYGFPVSMIIDKYDKRKWGARTRKDFWEAVNNPGFIDLFNEKEIKSEIYKIIEKNIEKLKGIPYLIKEWIKINNEYLCFSISSFPNIEGTFDCHVNNECFSWENPFENLQEEINKKNKKFDNYLEKCDECFLLIYNPDSSKGNYCHFTDKLKKKKFYYKFSTAFFYDENKKTTIYLKKI